LNDPKKENLPLDPTHEEFMQAARQAYGNRIVMPNAYTGTYMGTGTLAGGAVFAGACLLAAAGGSAVGYVCHINSAGPRGEQAVATGNPCCKGDYENEKIRTLTVTSIGSVRSLRHAESQARSICRTLKPNCKGSCTDANEHCVPRLRINLNNDYPAFFYTQSVIIFSCPCKCAPKPKGKSLGE
jgi:hypothetical protein